MTEEKGKTHYTYIVLCGDGTLYTGWTTDLSSRMEAHNSGAGAKYTRGRGPISLIYSEAYETKGEALKREIKIKKLTRAKKLKLAGLTAETTQKGLGREEQLCRKTKTRKTDGKTDGRQ